MRPSAVTGRPRTTTTGTRTTAFVRVRPRTFYGADHDDPHPGPLPHRAYAELVGGPLDGLLLDIHGWRTEEVDDGVALATELSRWPGGRALYDPRPGEPCTPGSDVICRFYYSGGTP
ncbi:hypothetical protein [Streptomyces olivaceoviridis]